jgi:hypothetical protein
MKGINVYIFIAIKFHDNTWRNTILSINECMEIGASLFKFYSRQSVMQQHLTNNQENIGVFFVS